MSHAAFVLPARARIFAPLPLAALVIGSMAPDIVYFIPVLLPYGNRTHDPDFMFTFNLALGLVVWALWRAIAPGLHEISPQVVRDRWRPDSWKTHSWWTVPVAIVIGISTHIIVDNFTHSYGWGPEHFEFLRATYSTPFGDLQGFKIGQYSSSILGLLIVLVVAACNRKIVAPPSKTPSIQKWLPGLVLTAGIVGAVVRTLMAGGMQLRFDSQVFYALTGGGMLAVLTIGLLSVVAQLMPKNLPESPAT